MRQEIQEAVTPGQERIAGVAEGGQASPPQILQRLCYSARRWTAREQGAAVLRWGNIGEGPPTLKVVGSLPVPQPSSAVPTLLAEARGRTDRTGAAQPMPGIEGR